MYTYTRTNLQLYLRESLLNCSSYSCIQRVTYYDDRVQSLAVEPSYFLFAAGHSKGGGVTVPDGNPEGKPPE